MDVSVEVVTTVDGQAVGVFVTSGNVSFALNQVCLAKILGDAWTVVDEGTETWADIADGTETWITQSEGSEAWQTISSGGETWSNVSEGAESWRPQ
jgi:hypothetical protein|tara:strand:+ start:482 stop:769 length:288 start_codon:yes stop_codon:yes gene_type:complete